jgi:hypothetical protein
MAEKFKNNKDSQKGQITPKNIFKKTVGHKDGADNGCLKQIY